MKSYPVIWGVFHKTLWGTQQGTNQDFNGMSQGFWSLSQRFWHFFIGPFKFCYLGCFQKLPKNNGKYLVAGIWDIQKTTEYFAEMDQTWSNLLSKMFSNLGWPDEAIFGFKHLQFWCHRGMKRKLFLVPFLDISTTAYFWCWVICTLEIRW